MDVRHDIDDAGLKKAFGLQTFNAGSALAGNGAVSAPRDVYPGITVYVVSDSDGDHSVLRRLRANRVDLLDCDCSEDRCKHIVAALLSSEEKRASRSEVDPEVLEGIQNLIESIVEDIIEDPDYDEDANYYEDWELEKYGLTNDNYDVEYSHTNDAIEKVIHEIDDPDIAVLLIDDLLSNLSKLEYDNDGVEYAFFEHESDICTLFSQATPETISKILKNRSYPAEMLYETYLEHVPKRRLDEAYLFLGDAPKLGEKGLEMQFERGDYDAYIRSSSRTTEAIIRVIEHLDAERSDSVSKYAELLKECPGISTNETAAKLLSQHGYKEEAAEIYQNLFLRSHRYEYFSFMKMNSERIDAEKMLDELAEDAFSSDCFDNVALSTLIRGGRASDVDRYIKKNGFVPKRNYRDYDCWDIPGICSAMLSRGFVESAAILGRGLIHLRLRVKDADRYGDAVEMMRFMDSEGRFEELDEPHSVFKARLKTEYPKMRKFWGLYEGTWR